MITPGIERRWVAVDHPGWRQAHASTVLAVDGGLVAAWFGGTREGTPDNRIWLAHRPAGALSWRGPFPLAEADEAHWNPVLAHGPDGAVWLFFKRGPLISRWTTWFCRSEDGGSSWSPPAELVPGDAGGRGPVKNPPLLLDDGAWLAPASSERWDDAPVWDAFVDRSTDGGRTWTAAPVPLDRARLIGAGVIQPALWQREGAVFALLRSTEGSAYRSWSDDGGVTWSPATATALANNNSGLTVAALPDGRVACVHNPVSESWGARCPLVVSVSADDGLTWRAAVTVEDGVTPFDDHPGRAPALPPPGAFSPADAGVATTGVGEYSYPAALVDGDTFVITYTWQRRGIVEARVPIALLHP
ncbi:sialidase family protein [Georgenia thermotolerans]|uniref:Neuraminidase (Sialidase) n=1 Tax=Georgenia thermotolerans TaxID=527326 RepID=A0A7J5UV37_9MICO|nr:sialidase family protein [Georgenia thermotolerans]KAE8766130.1 neuraminidase (sialidase) [Georgenia thermotolerans]